MRLRVLVASAAGVAVAATLTVTLPALAGTSPTPSAAAMDLAREALPANDGWAAAGRAPRVAPPPRTHVFVAPNRAELIAALGGNNATNGGQRHAEDRVRQWQVQRATSTTPTSR